MKIFFKRSKTLSLMVPSLLIFLIGVSGCETLKHINQFGKQENIKYVSSLDENVKLVVIPFNDYLSQLEFSTNIESVLLKVGLNVISSPRGTKTIEERKGAGVAQDSGGHGDVATRIQREESQALRIEKYTVLEETKADYIIETMLTGYDGTIRITRKSDAKVISVFTVSDNPYHLEDDLITQLEKIKFIVQLKEENSRKQ